MTVRTSPPQLSATALHAAVYLLPGDLRISTRGVVLRTVLGSCVSVCLWDASTGYGGMNHFLLPAPVRDLDDPYRYGDISTRRLIERLERAGAKIGTTSAKLFGGAGILLNDGKPVGDLGLRNTEIARTVLAEHRIPIVEEDVLGEGGRRVVFDVGRGSTWVRRL